MTTAPLADQVALLDVAALDVRTVQLVHRRRTLPEHAALAALAARERTLLDAATAARTLASDLDRALVTAEEGVRQVRERATRNQARLDAGAGAKDATALQRDLTALARRQGELEEAQLEVMERAEAAQAQVAAVTADLEALAVERAALTASRDAALAETAAEGRRVAAARAGAVQGLDAGLIALYERLRAASGLGAAALQGAQCGGCRTTLSVTELSRARAQPPDAVVRCEECERILVRVDPGGAS